MSARYVSLSDWPDGSSLIASEFEFEHSTSVSPHKDVQAGFALLAQPEGERISYHFIFGGEGNETFVNNSNYRYRTNRRIMHKFGTSRDRQSKRPKLACTRLAGNFRAKSDIDESEHRTARPERLGHHSPERDAVGRWRREIYRAGRPECLCIRIARMVLG